MVNSGRGHLAVRDEADSKKRLHHFVFEFQPRSDLLPKQILPGVVQEFVRQTMVEKNLNPEVFGRLVELADFYECRDLANDFLTRLDGTAEDADDFLVSLHCIRAGGILGNEMQLERSSAIFRQLVDLPVAKSRIPEILECYNVVCSAPNRDFLEANLRKLKSDLQSQKAGNEAAVVNDRDVADTLNNVFPRIGKAQSIRDEIMNADDATRLDRLVGIYLNLDTAYREWLDRWSVRMLMSELNKNGPKEIVAAFRRGLSRIDTSEPNEEARKAIRGVCCHALEFFGNELSDGEQHDRNSVPRYLSGLLTLDLEPGENGD